jgi:hypothetical protein
MNLAFWCRISVGIWLSPGYPEAKEQSLAGKRREKKEVKMIGVLLVVLYNLSLLLMATIPTLMLYVDVDEAEGMEFPLAAVLFMNMLGSSGVEFIIAMIYFILNLVFFVRTRIKLGI